MQPPRQRANQNCAEISASAPINKQRSAACFRLVVFCALFLVLRKSKMRLKSEVATCVCFASANASPVFGAGIRKSRASFVLSFERRKAFGGCQIAQFVFRMFPRACFGFFDVSRVARNAVI